MIKVLLLLLGCAIIGMFIGAWLLCKISHAASELEKKIFGESDNG